MVSAQYFSTSVYVDILQRSSVMKFVWGEMNSGYEVVTKAKNIELLISSNVRVI